MGIVQVRQAMYHKSVICSVFACLLLAQHSFALTCLSCTKGESICGENADNNAGVSCDGTSKGCQITEFSATAGVTYERKCSPPEAEFGPCVVEADPHEDTVTKVCNCNDSDNCNANLCTAGDLEHPAPCPDASGTASAFLVESSSYLLACIPIIISSLLID